MDTESFLKTYKRLFVEALETIFSLRDYLSSYVGKVNEVDVEKWERIAAAYAYMYSSIDDIVDVLKEPPKDIVDVIGWDFEIEENLSSFNSWKDEIKDLVIDRKSDIKEACNETIEKIHGIYTELDSLSVYYDATNIVDSLRESSIEVEISNGLIFDIKNPEDFHFFRSYLGEFDVFCECGEYDDRKILFGVFDFEKGSYASRWDWAPI